MSNEEEQMEWHEVGTVDELKSRKCRRLYTQSGNDLALFCLNGEEFYATSAACPHAKGPLDQGDIEDLGNGRYILTCPLHYYSFDLKSGVSASGLKLQTYATEVKEGQLFVRASEMVSLKSVKK